MSSTHAFNIDMANVAMGNLKASLVRASDPVP